MNRYFATVANKILFSNFIRFIFCIVTVSLSLSLSLYIYIHILIRYLTIVLFDFYNFSSRNFSRSLGRICFSFFFLFFYFVENEQSRVKTNRSKNCKKFCVSCIRQRELESISIRYIFISFFLVIR